MAKFPGSPGQRNRNLKCSAERVSHQDGGRTGCYRRRRPPSLPETETKETARYRYISRDASLFAVRHETDTKLLLPRHSPRPDRGGIFVCVIFSTFVILSASADSFGGSLFSHPSANEATKYGIWRSVWQFWRASTCVAVFQSIITSCAANGWDGRQKGH